MGQHRISYTKPLVAGALVSGMAGVVGVAAAGASNNSSSNAGTGPKGATIAPAPVQGDASLATVIENIGLSYSSVFAGAEKLADGQVRVHTIPGHDSAFRAALPAVTDTASGPSYFFVPANYSLDDLNALTQQIAADNDSLKAKGIELAGWGPDYASNTVSIQLQQYTPSAAAYLQSTYGAEVSVATVSSPLPAPATDRYSDIAPWYSGDAIWSPGYTPPPPQCTESFSYTGNNTGNIFTLTAGHCFPQGTTVYTNYTSSFVMGTVSTRYLSNNGPDIDTIPTSAAPYEWTTGTSIIGVYASEQPAVGDTVTVNGATTGEVRSVTVESVNICEAFGDGLTRCHLDEVHQTGGEAIIQGGDSGGPVYQYVTGEDYIKANGIIIGGFFSSGNPSTGYYQEISYVLTTVNGSLQTIG